MARLVAGGHMTDPPSFITYSSVVSRDSVRISFLLAALHEIDMWSCDVTNAYIQAPTKENIWFIADAEFGDNAEKKVLIIRALYELKGSSVAQRSQFVQGMSDLELEFVPCRADLDVWRRPAKRPDGYEYCELILVYVGDIICCSHQAREVIASIGDRYQLKKG